MSPEEYHGRVVATFWWGADYVPPQKLRQAWSLIEHGEPAEGLVYLAWVLANNEVRVPMALINDIYRYTAGMIEHDDLPPGLSQLGLSAETTE